ncbi:alkaline phosphatase family protein [Dictyobacter formicarum]|uniref:Acid phosphatase n=1 Tax=Dictyobacter formicarum TaxID=2778368 RepID=A0ABQ3VCC8_9CHLR|nr:alkaline phosphatase family protein [Dictyobacter formicarum]GHO83557.1 acid phosphatase [Dictyobacter formicarum]
MKVRIFAVVLVCVVVLVAGALLASLFFFKPGETASQALIAQTKLPRPDHVVIVVEENHNYSDIIGSAEAPYINSLTSNGAVFTNFHAETHPSQPNYLALYSGSTQGVTSDACPNTFSGPNLGQSLLNAHLSFKGYSDSMPSAAYTGCAAPDSLDALYARKHNPWVNFTNVPAGSNVPYTQFPTDYSQLPTVSFVIPNQVHDMHSASIAAGDTWLKDNLDGYARWANTHNSLLIVTWDEDDGSDVNQVLTLMSGSMVKPGRYNENVNHYNLLRTLEDMYKLPPINQSATVPSITDVWR